MADRPTGTVTFLFTDIEGSTRLLQRLGETYGEVLARHHGLVRDAIRRWHGVEVKTEGDSFFVVFTSPADAIQAAADAQLAMAREPWPDDAEVWVRMGIHTGEAAFAADDYMGLDVHRAARISEAAHGGQVLISDSTRELVEGALPDRVRLKDLGDHRLRDLDRPERLHQLVVESLRSEFPPIHSLSARLDVLPPELTSFIGREREVEEVADLLKAMRLLTLTGPGGTGKTRLALGVARHVTDAFRDGVAFVELAAIFEPDLVAPTIRHVLGLREEAGRRATETLVDALRNKEVLLVIDNFEQVLEGAPVLAELLAATTRLRLLVTSRSILHLTGEQEYPVPPLALPRADEVGDVRRLSRSEAVALFVQRARAARPGFELAEENAAAIVEVCRRLDGLPLAIELAASRVKLLPPTVLRARLGQSLDLLQSTAADRTDRQRTLRGAIAWSYDLLDETERAFFQRLAIFVGGWTYDAAEALVRGSGGPHADVLMALERLVDQSLIRTVETGGELRFQMLETIREFGLERLVLAGEREAVAQAHAAHFVSLVREAEPRLTMDPALVDRLERDIDNLRVMLRWSAEADRLRLGLEAAGSLWRFWHLRGHLREGRAQLTSLLAHPGAAEPSRARAKALIGLAGIVYWMGDYADANRHYEEALSIARTQHDRRLEAEILYSLGYVNAIRRDWEAALSALGDAQRIYEELGDPAGAASSVMASGMVESLRGRHDVARSLLRPVIETLAELGDEFSVTNAMQVLARTQLLSGDVADARDLTVKSIRIRSTQRNPTGLSAGLLDMASLEALAGRHERAARLVGAASRIVEQAGGQAPPELVNRIDPVPILEAALDRPTLGALLEEGRRMDDDAAVEYALRSTEPLIRGSAAVPLGGPRGSKR